MMTTTSPGPDFPEIMGLRRDFALEIGFVDAVREPLPAVFRAQVEAMRTTQGQPYDFDEINRRKAAYQLPRYCGYFYASTCAFVCDWGNEITVKYWGLFKQMLDQVAKAAGEARLIHHFGNPIVQPDDADEPEPEAILIHDTHTGRCFLAPFAAGRTFLRAQAQS
jgi:hypothetical protein